MINRYNRWKDDSTIFSYNEMKVLLYFSFSYEMTRAVANFFCNSLIPFVWQIYFSKINLGDYCELLVWKWYIWLFIVRVSKLRYVLWCVAVYRHSIRIYYVMTDSRKSFEQKYKWTGQHKYIKGTVRIHC